MGAVAVWEQGLVETSPAKTYPVYILDWPLVIMRQFESRSLTPFKLTRKNHDACA